MLWLALGLFGWLSEPTVFRSFERLANSIRRQRRPIRYKYEQIGVFRLHGIGIQTQSAILQGVENPEYRSNGAIS